MSESNYVPIAPTDAFLNEWGIHAEEKSQRAYLESELDRAIDTGLPVLHLAMLLPFDGQRNLVISALAGRGYVPQLRLVRGSDPPTVDPNGSPVPEAKRGNVLIAKTGTLGAPEKASGGESDVWNAPSRILRARTGKALYATQSIGRNATPVLMSNAIAVLRQWGVGCKSARFEVTDEKLVTDANGNREKIQVKRDRWIVEEVTEAMTEREQRGGSSNAATGKASRTKSDTASAAP